MGILRNITKIPKTGCFSRKITKKHVLSFNVIGNYSTEMLKLKQEQKQGAGTKIAQARLAFAPALARSAPLLHRRDFM